MSLKLALIGWCAMAAAATVFTNDEVDVVISTLKLLAIGECILVHDATNSTAAQEVKRLNGEFILAGVMGEGRLRLLLAESKPPDAATAIVLKLETPSAVKDLLKENSKRLYWFAWFLIGPDDLAEEIRIPFNCQFFRIKKDADRTHKLIESYSLKNSSTFRNEFGSWSRGEGLRAGSTNMYRRRTDLRGVELEITVCERYNLEEKLREFWMELSRRLNFSLKMEPQRLNKTTEGYILLQDPDGTTCVWGITGLDFDRDWVMLHSGIIVKLAMKFRTSNDIGWRAYVQPFKKEMWQAVGLWLFFSTLAIVAATGCTRKNLYLNAFTAFFCLCNSDPMTVHPPGEPVSLTTKLVYLMVLVVPAVMVPAYSAYVLSTLSIVLPLEPFRDLKGLVADGTYRVTAVDNTFAIRYLRGSGDPDIKYIYEHLFVGADNAPPSYWALFEELCGDSKLAGLIPYARSMSQMFQCRMFVAPQELTTISTGILFPKGSPLRKIFSERFNDYYEKGMLRSESEVESHSYNPFGEDNEALRSLDLSQMGPILLLIPLGVVLSLAVLVAEVAVKRHADKSAPSHSTKYSVDC